MLVALILFIIIKSTDKYFEKSLKTDQYIVSINSHNSCFRTFLILIIPMTILVYLRFVLSNSVMSYSL